MLNLSHVKETDPDQLSGEKPEKSICDVHWPKMGSPQGLFLKSGPTSVKDSTRTLSY